MPIQNIKRVRPIEPAPDSGYEVAYGVHLDDGPEPQAVVEYAKGAGHHASEAHVRRALAPYLDEDELPARLIVDHDGTIRAAD